MRGSFRSPTVSSNSSTNRPLSSTHPRREPQTRADSLQSAWRVHRSLCATRATRSMSHWPPSLPQLSRGMIQCLRCSVTRSGKEKNAHPVRVLSKTVLVTLACPHEIRLLREASATPPHFPMPHSKDFLQSLRNPTSQPPVVGLHGNHLHSCLSDQTARYGNSETLLPSRCLAKSALTSTCGLAWGFSRFHLLTAHCPAQDKFL